MSDNVRKARKFTKEQWINKFKKVHGDIYDYSKVKIQEGNGSSFKIIITCKKHGDFIQTPNAHLHMNKCPYCNISKGEDEIEKYLINNNISYIRQHKFLDCINPKTKKYLPFDFYLPNSNSIIEYHGEQHYKEYKNYFQSAGGLKGRQYRDKIKFKFCNQEKITYILISYKEFNNINNILNKTL
jgi:hypothetical protein